MMQYIKLSTLQFPLYQGDIRLEHPEIGDEFVCPSTYAPVTVTSYPTIDVKTQKTHFGVPYESSGQWVVDPVIVELTDEEKAGKNMRPSELIKDPKIRAIMEQLERNAE